MKQTLLIISGLPGTGKSYLADKIAGKLCLKVLRTDEIRKELAGISREEHKYEKFKKGIYSKEMNERTYREMFNRTKKFLKEGKSCILDATFSMRKDRKMAEKIAREAGAVFLIIECICPEEIVIERMKKRIKKGTISDATIGIYQRMKEQFEQIRDDEPHLTVDTSQSRELVVIAHKSDLDGISCHGILHRYANLRGIGVRHYLADYENFNQILREISNLKEKEIVIADICWNETFSREILKKLSREDSVGWFDHHLWERERLDFLDKVVLDKNYCAAELVQGEFLPMDEISREIAELAHAQDFRLKNELAWKLYDVISSGYDKEKLIEFLSSGEFWNDELERVYREYQGRKESAKSKLDGHTKIYKIGNLNYAIGLSGNELGTTTATGHLLQRNTDIVVCIWRNGKMSFRRNNKKIDLVEIAKKFNGGGREDAAGGFFNGEITEENYPRVFDEIVEIIS